MKLAHRLLLQSLAIVAVMVVSVVVIIDPVTNPDGRDRYVSWYNSVRGVRPS